MVVDYLAEFVKHAPLALAMARAADATMLAQVSMAEPILDLGCGQGWFGEALLDDAAVVGVDHDERDVERARACGYNVIEGEADDLPFADDLFGTVLANSVLQLVDLEAVLPEIHRVLKPGGKLVATVPSPDFGGGVVPLRLLDWYFAHRQRPTETRWRADLLAVGFEEVRCEPYFPRRAQRLYELLLPAAVPSALCLALTGRWVYGGRQWVRRLWARHIWPLIDRYDYIPGPEGPYSYFLLQAVK